MLQQLTHLFFDAILHPSLQYRETLLEDAEGALHNIAEGGVPMVKKLLCILGSWGGRQR